MTTTWRMVSATRTPVTPGYGWTPPARPTSRRGYVDWVAVERFLGGDINPDALHHHERCEAARILHLAGRSRPDIAERFHATEDTVDNLLAAFGLLPPERICARDNCWRATSGNKLCKRHLATERNAAIRARRDDKIRQLAADHSPEDIARKLRSNPHAIRQIMARLGLDVPPPAPPRCGTQTAYARHIKNDEPVDDACAAAHEAHLERKRQAERRRIAGTGPTSISHDAVARLAAEGHSSARIAVELGCSRWTVQRVLTRQRKQAAA